VPARSVLASLARATQGGSARDGDALAAQTVVATLRGERRGRPGRPRIDPEAQLLIRRMASENTLRGSRRVVAELRALGIEVSNSTVRRYKAEMPKPSPGQRWSTLFYNHGPYLRDALREAVDDRARRVLEALQQLVDSRLGRRPRIRAEQWSEVPGDVRGLIDARQGSPRSRRLDHESQSDRARDGPNGYRDAA
jgi:hypothetical protein